VAQTLKEIAGMFAMGMSEGEVEEKLAEEIPTTVEVESGRAPAKRTAPNVQALVQSLAEDQEDRARVLTELQNVLQEQRGQLTRLTELMQDLKRSWWERLIGHKGKTDRLRGQTDDLGPGKTAGQEASNSIQREQHAFGKKSHGALYGQETRTPHLMRISLIIVGARRRGK
jgi:hypothetical protein